MGIIQLEQDLALCASKFPTLTCRPLAAQFMHDDLIALFEFERSEGKICIKEEKHYCFGLNTEQYLDFHSEEGIPLAPVVVRFKTRRAE